MVPDSPWLSIEHCKSADPPIDPWGLIYYFFLTFSGAVEGSVWNTVTKALSLPTVIGQTGLPGHRAPGPAEEGCPTETASALIPSKQVWISQLTSEHLSATSLSNSACTWAQSYSFCTSNFIVRKLSRKAFSLKQF